MIAQLDDSIPQVARHDGKVAIIATPPGEDDHGFLLAPGLAVTVALRMIRAVADIGGETAIAPEITGMTFRVDHRPAEPLGLLTFTVGGAELDTVLTPGQIADLAAAFTAACRSIDANGPHQPKKAL